MSTCLTLYVLHSDRDPEIATDGVQAARWASEQSCQVLLVVPVGASAQYDSCGADLVVESAAKDDFRFYDGLRHATHKGVKFEQAICFRDDTAFLGRGVDVWFGERFYKESADLVGVADRQYCAESFMRLTDRFAAWGLPHESWDRPPNSYTIHPAAFGLTKKLVRELFYRHLLVTEDHATWPLSFGAYATWTCQLLMQVALLRGSMDRPQPPLYLNDGWGGTYNPPPYLLHSGVLLYWSLRRVAGYSEAETRSWCRSLRQAKT
jgi:hypothetical protein